MLNACVQPNNNHNSKAKSCIMNIDCNKFYCHNIISFNFDFS